MTKPYYVDERVGAVAVRDRRVPCGLYGLSSKMPGVVKFWQGRLRGTLERRLSDPDVVCMVPQRKLLAARRLCKQLNDAFMEIEEEK